MATTNVRRVRIDGGFNGGFDDGVLLLFLLVLLLWARVHGLFKTRVEAGL